jgi:hypothetical protein
MHNIKKTIRTAVLYTFSVILVGGVPMAAFADNSDACIASGHLSERWATDPVTTQCVKLYDTDGNFVGPSYMAPPPPTPSPTPTPPPSPDATTDASSPTTSATVQDSGTGNTTGSDSTTNGTANTTDNTNATVDNQIGSTATSGSATVQGNQSTGSAGSGGASTDSTVVNSVHSTVGSSTGVATFSYDVNGNVVGDITISGTGSQASATNTTNLNSNTIANNNAAITNNINGTATSGDATVQGNSSTGSATTGSANAMANILNLINTIIASNQSFIGTINIYGNLNGDILLSPEFIPQLIASNNGTVTSTDNLALSTNLNNNSTIVNNVDLTATSGTATVQGNSSTGSATTGNTQTNLTILNLTGHTVNAANSLLVFVNVLGTWVGMIIDAPGATAAALGSGIVSNTTNLTSNTTLNNTAAITNNINLAAVSGNALVDGNSSAGNATSGNATASANIANISTSIFNLSGWFGVLYINVFGTWLGSFGIDTSAGTATPISGMAAPDSSGVIASPAMHFGFVPKASGQEQLSAFGLGTDDGGSSAAAGGDPTAILAAAHHTALAQPQTLTPIPSPTYDPFSTILMIAGFSTAGVSGAWMLIRRRMELRAAAL